MGFNPTRYSTFEEPDPCPENRQDRRFVVRVGVRPIVLIGSGVRVACPQKRMESIRAGTTSLCQKQRPVDRMRQTKKANMKMKPNMKTIPKTYTCHHGHRMTTLALNFGLIAGLAALPLQAQDDENIPAGYNEEEWYDPSDWFDGDNIERAGNDAWDNEGWSDSIDDDQGSYRGSNRSSDRNNDRSSYSSGYGKDKTSGTDKQSGWSQRQDGSERTQQANRKQERPMKKVSLSGELEGFKKVNVKDRQGKQDEQTFVRIRLEDENARVVSLGSRLILTDLGLEKGDQISVSGRNARINNRDVLVASSIEVDDKLFRVREDNRPETGGQSSIEGTVKDFSKTRLSDDSREENLLIRLELKSGKSCVVDLGQGTSLSELDIEKGSEISLTGMMTKVDGKSLIVARSVTVDGESTRLRQKSTGIENARRDSRYDTLEPVTQE